MTGQETDISIHYIKDISIIDDTSDLIINTEYYLDRPIYELPMNEKGTLFQ